MSKNNNNKEEQKTPLEEELNVEPKDLTGKTEPAPTPESDEDKVLIDKLTLANIMERLDSIEGTNVRKPVQLKNKTCRVRMVEVKGEDKVVIGYGKSFDRRNIDGSKTLIMEVIIEGGKKVEVEFVDFNESGKQIKAEIVGIKETPHEESLGSVYAIKVDYDNYRTYETDKKVPLIVKSVHREYTVKLPDETEIILDESAIN